MLRENTKIRNAAAALQAVFSAEDVTPEAVQAAFDQFGVAIAEDVRADFEAANGDRAILAQRGFRQLTAAEQRYYEAIIEAGKSDNPVQTYAGLLDDKVMPNTTIEDVYKDLVAEHPLLSAINFTDVKYLTRWILNDHSKHAAVWGAVNSQITEQILSAFRVVEMTQCKLSAYALIEKDMLDLGPVFLDNYIRTFLKEAIAIALETAIVSGTGKNQPRGLDRDIHHGVTVSDGVYPQKTPVTLASFSPKDYGEILAILAKTEVWYTADADGTITAAGTAANADGSPKSGYTKHGGADRVFDRVLMIANMQTYFRKIMPATTVMNAAGEYVSNRFPFPTDFIPSGAVADGEAIVCLPKEYFMGVGTNKNGTLEYTDERYFLEDQRCFKIKMHGNGTAFDDTCAVLLDVSNIEEGYVYIKAADVSVDIEGATGVTEA